MFVVQEIAVGAFMGRRAQQKVDEPDLYWSDIRNRTSIDDRDSKKSSNLIADVLAVPSLQCLHQIWSPLACYLLPASFLNLPAAVEGAASGQLLTASSTSSKNVVLLCMLVAPRTTLTPGELALTWAIIFASS